ncbi:MAG TPA: hypothetical protein VN718_06765 [Rhizomicrobium sp.]|nr:hypothetical protein [Rhizomicrobium sp.]
MKIKFLVPTALALSVLAVPALARDYYYSYGDRPITGAQLTDMPSQRANVTRSGSFLRPESGYAVRDRDYATQRAYDRGYRDGYYDGDSDD